MGGWGGSGGMGGEGIPRREAGLVEQTYLAFINNTNAWFLGGTVNFCFPQGMFPPRFCFALEATSARWIGKERTRFTDGESEVLEPGGNRFTLRRSKK